MAIGGTRTTVFGNGAEVKRNVPKPNVPESIFVFFYKSQLGMRECVGINSIYPPSILFVYSTMDPLMDDSKSLGSRFLEFTNPAGYNAEKKTS